MKIKMLLLSDMIFGNGESVPGAEDISVLHDSNGFPYYKGGTFKGVFREELERYLMWNGIENTDKELCRLLGESGLDIDSDKLIFSDFVLSDGVKKTVINQIGDNKPEEVMAITTNLRTFTKINENGTAAKGSLRVARCVDKGLVFYGNIVCNKSDEKLVKEVISGIKWLGTMRNRGFGKVKMTVVEEENND